MAYTTIDRPSDYFRSKLWTGDGSDNRAITFDESDNMQPNWVWYKARNHAYNHGLFDSVRGVDKFLSSNLAGAESTISGIAGFNSNGFTVGNDAGSNGSSKTFVGWSWKAGTSFTNDASSTGIGTIDSTGSASDTAGFSIVSYTGTGSAGTIKHGLSSIPKMIIVKDRDNGSYSWHVYTATLGNTKTIYLDLANAPDTGSTYWNNTTPTSSVFSVGSSVTTNKSSDKFIAYCFADVKGYSKVGGSYTGNLNANGTFVYTGFLPAFVMVKAITSAPYWTIIDNKRPAYNPTDEWLYANSSEAAFDASSYPVDFVSNGFKIRNVGSYFNSSGVTYIYMAFAEHPFVTSTGIPTTAR